MTTNISSAELPTRIQKLLEDRQQHIDAVAAIDQTLAGVGAVLGGTTALTNGKRPATAPAAMQAPAKGKRRGRRGNFATTSEESISAFVKLTKNPTTQDIKKHWEGEGRNGRPDNTLSLMVKSKKLKRTPLGKGIMGSRYSLA